MKALRAFAIVGTMGITGCTGHMSDVYELGASQTSGAGSQFTFVNNTRIGSLSPQPPMAIPDNSVREERNVTSPTNAMPNITATPFMVEFFSSVVSEDNLTRPHGHMRYCAEDYNRCLPYEQPYSVVRINAQVMQKMMDINLRVNRQILPREDMDIYGEPERWAIPTTEGDCEDYGLLKEDLLIQAGFPPSALSIAVVKQSNGDPHAVLIVRTNEGDYSLDNLTNEIVLIQDTPYELLKRQSYADPKVWTHITTEDTNMVSTPTAISSSPLSQNSPS